MLKILINNEEVVCDKQINITKELLTTSSVILNNVYPKSWEIDKDVVSRFYYPKDYSLCNIYNENILVFSGIIKNSGNISLNPREPKYVSLQVLDFKTFLSEGILLDFVINNKTILEAITEVINQISSYGFILGVIELDEINDIIGSYNVAEKTPYDFFQYIAEITSAKWFTRTIDENTTAIDFYDIEKLPLKEDLQYNEQYFEENNIVDIKFSYGTRDYRNNQTILSDTVFNSSQIEETYNTIGEEETITLQNTVASIVYMEDVQSGNPYIFATVDDKNLGLYADFYYTPNSNVLEVNVPLQSGRQIYIVYSNFIKGRQSIFNNQEINRLQQQMGRNGLITRYETRNDILTTNELVAVANTYLKYKGIPEILLTINTFNKDLYEIGDQVFFAINVEELTNLRQLYMVKTKKINSNITGNEEVIFYEYQLTNSFTSEKQINYFDNQRRKANGNIQSGQYITRNEDIVSETNIIFKNLNIEEVVITDNNVLNSTLNSPFVE